jgi:Tfp pilus assembly protein PilF
MLVGGLYFIAFATTSNILMPIGTIMGERLAYLPSAGFCLLVTLGYFWLQERHKKLAQTTLVVLLALFSVRTVIRNRDWKDSFTLYSAQVHAAPNSAKTHQNMAFIYMNKQQLDLARRELEIAVQIYPVDAQILATYGLLESWQGNYQKAGMLMERAFSMIDHDNPAYDEIAANLADVYVQTNHIDGALDLLNKEISESPGYARAWANRAVVHYKLGEIDAARADAENALRLDPSNQKAKDLMMALIPKG